MIELTKINEYRENNRLEAKKATGGLPKSVWETYSAFANTNGGVIILGVGELSTKELNIIGLKNPEVILKDLWDNLNNSQKVSINLLKDSHISIKERDGKKVILIEVPRALRINKPVYINDNPFSGSFRRDGEGDYHCSKEEVLNMMRDSGNVSQDLRVIYNMDLTAFDYDSIRRYRTRMSNLRPLHVWENFSDDEFLYRLGAVDRIDGGNKFAPTMSGLLMFGYEYEIVKEFPYYFLDYREKLDADSRWSDRVVSNSGEWSGNIFDFYFKVYAKLVQDLKVPFKLDKGLDRIDDTPLHKVLREALANAIIHANYYEKQGVVIEKKFEQIEISNPGCFRISIDEAISGGISDPRNMNLIKMFNLINIGERAGSGVPSIYDICERHRWEKPKLMERFDPDRSTLIINMTKIVDKKSLIKIVDKKSPIKNVDKDKTSEIAQKHKMRIIGYFKENNEAKAVDVAREIGLKTSRTRDYLKELITEGYIISEGQNKNRIYKKKE